MAEFRLSNFTSGTALTAAELNTGLTFTDYTPTFTQSATITKTVNFARYTVFGKLVVASIRMTATSAGTANNKVIVGLPVNATSNSFHMGTYFVFKSGSLGSNGNNYNNIGHVLYESTSTVCFSVRNQNGAVASSSDDKRLGENYTSLGVSTTGYTFVSGDIINIQLMYEAA